MTAMVRLPSMSSFAVEYPTKQSTVAGLQYYSICRILMLAYDPYIPSLGPDRHEAMRIVDVSRSLLFRDLSSG